MDKAQMRKFANIAHVAGVSWAYCVYLEDALINNQPLDDEMLAKQIYEVAVDTRKTRLRKRKEAITIDTCTSTATQMCSARYFARINGGLDDYAQYIEGCLSNNHPFDLEECIEAVFSAIMAKYKWSLARRIADATGIAVGGEDAV